MRTPSPTSAACSVLDYGGNPNPGANLDPTAHAASVEVWRYGGHRGGWRRRKDGLCSGSPEAIAADRAKDAERKRRSRAARRAALMSVAPYPPEDGFASPLPSTTPTAMSGKGSYASLFVLAAAFVALALQSVASMRKLDSLIAERDATQSTKGFL